jgi:hypothetical protein
VVSSMLRSLQRLPLGSLPQRKLCLQMECCPCAALGHVIRGGLVMVAGRRSVSSSAAVASLPLISLCGVA